MQPPDKKGISLHLVAAMVITFLSSIAVIFGLSIAVAELSIRLSPPSESQRQNSPP